MNKSKQTLVLCCTCGSLAFTVGVAAQTSIVLPLLAHASSLNRSGTDITNRPDLLGISLFKKNSRTPTGFIYPGPMQVGSDRELTGPWRYGGSTEIGYLGHDTEETAAEFHDYRDIDEGILLNFINLSFQNTETGLQLGLLGGSLGRDDQYLTISGRIPGRFQVKGNFSAVPHEYGRNAKTIFQGAGSNNLTLQPGLSPGNNSLEHIKQALENAATPTLRLNREQTGFSMLYNYDSGLKLQAEFKHDQRRGARPFGASLLPPFFTGASAGGMIETIEPIDYATNEFSGGLGFTSTQLLWSLNYKASIFSNESNELTFESPFTNIPFGNFPLPQGRIDLYPDNSYQEVTGTVTYQLPMHSQLYSTVSWSSMRQDDALLPPTINSGATFGGLDLDFWNSTAALSTSNAAARINNLLVHTGIRFTPWRRIGVNASLRYQDQENSSAYTALNPLTGEYGYITEDGASDGSVFSPGFVQDPIHYRSIPFANSTFVAKVETTYRLGTKNNLGVDLEREHRNLENRERAWTETDQLGIYITNRNLTWATLRLAYEYSNRSGSKYQPNPYTAFFTSSLPGYRAAFPEGQIPHTLAELRKFDLSDWQQNKVTIKSNFLLGETMDLVFTANLSRIDYDASYGLQNRDTSNFNLEWNYQPSPALNAFAFYSHENSSSRMSSINDAGASANASAGGATYPLEGVWQEASDGSTHYTGAGFSVNFAHMSLESSYTYSSSVDSTFLLASSINALANPEFGALKSSLPDMDYRLYAIETSLNVYPSNRFGLRLFHRYEQGITTDWHYQNLQPLITRHLFLDAQPQNYSTHLIGLFLQYRIE
jgi:MtrB/PioB family decaheme-associated outer membrane protein